MGTKYRAQNIPSSRLLDRAVLVIAPMLAVNALAFVFSDVVAKPEVGPGWQMGGIIASAFVTSYAHDTYGPHVKGRLADQVRRAFPAAIALAVVAPLLSTLVGINGYAAVGASAGYLFGFTWSRFNRH